MSGFDNFHEYTETWTITKPSVRSAGGMIASQHALASDVGASVLASGGNAVDAAVAAGLAIGAVEPWMSGLGGGGFMLIYRAEEDRAYCVQFGMRASFDLNPADYPLSEGGQDSDLFHWPAVLEDRNVLGPYSVAVPGAVKGHALALSQFGTRSWEETIEPAVGLARAGMAVDWYATLRIASEARSLSRDAECARVYLPGGFAPAGSWGGPIPRIALGNLASTYERLQSAGPEDFYTGELARSISEDCATLGAQVSADDLARYEAFIVPVEPAPYRDAQVYAAPGLSAGPTLLDALARLGERWEADPSEPAPDARAFAAYGSALEEAYALRLATLGEDRDGRLLDGTPSPGCTTHMSVVDEQGNFVALTQTLLSVFGSKVMLPGSGLLMNNGIMWFDPRAGKPNSMAPGKRPLSNMCPTLVRRSDGRMVALGASGGRRIMPAVFQLLSFVTDFGMDVGEAMHTPRIDVSGEPVTLADRRLGEEALGALAGSREQMLAVQHGVHPALFACPNVVSRDAEHGESEGAAYVYSPWAKVACG